MDLKAAAGIQLMILGLNINSLKKKCDLDL